MSTTYDNRVVSLKFDNSGFSKKVAETRAQLQKLNESLALSSADEGSERVSNFFSKLNKEIKVTDLNPLDNAVQKVTESFSKLEVIALGALFRIGQRAADVGMDFAKKLSIDQAAAGFNKYEQILKSTQTILATDENLTQDYVNAQLKKLTWYTDETSYAMTDMVSNISQFTNMGIPLDRAVQDMIGVGNAAGMAGASVSQATHAMQGFSKAMAQGNMTKNIWSTWIKNSTIGTMEFKRQAIEAAKTLGTIKQASDGLWYSIYDTSKSPAAVTAENFDASLTKGKWFNTEVMEAVLQKYSKSVNQLYAEFEKGGQATSAIIEEMEGKLDKFSLKAFRLAQEATTFRQAVDSLFDAMSSRWSEIFTLIFGDYEQARKLWTDLANWLYDTFMTPVDNLQAKIEKWSNTFVKFTKDVETGIKKTVTARDILIDGIKNVFKFFYNATDEIDSLVEVIGEAWEKVFGKVPTSLLVELTIRFNKFTDRLANSKSILDKIKRVFVVIFTIMKAIKDILIAIGNILKKVVWPVVKVIFNFVWSILEVLLGAVEGFAKSISGLSNTMFGSVKKIKNVVQITKQVETDLAKTKSTIDDATKSVKEAEEAIEDAEDAEEKASKTTKKTKKTTEETAEAIDEVTKNLQKAIAEGKTFSDANYIYTKNGLKIPKHVKIVENSILGSLQKVVKAIKSIGTGTTSIEKNVQDSFKKTGAHIEKTYRRISNTAKTISKNSLLYKSSAGIRKLTNGLFSAMDKSFNRTKTNITGTSKLLKNMFGILHKNKKVSTPVVSAKGSSSSSNDTKKLSDSIQKTSKKNKDTIDGIKKDTKSLIDVYDEASKNPDELTTKGQKIAKKVEDTLGKAVEKVFTSTLHLFGEEANSIDISDLSTSDKVKKLVETIKDLIKKNVSKETTDKIKEIFTSLGSILKDVLRIFKEVFQVFGRSITDMLKKLGLVDGSAKNGLETFKMVVDRVHEVVLALKEWISNFELIDSKTGELTKHGERLKKVLDFIVYIIGGIGWVIKKVWTVIKTIWDFIWFLSEGTKDKTEETGNVVVNTFKKIFERIKKIDLGGIFSGIGEHLTKFKNKIVSAFGAVSSRLKALFESIKKLQIKKGIEEFLDSLPTKFWTAYGKIVYIFNNIADIVAKGLDKMTTKEFWSNLANKSGVTYVKGIAESLVGILSLALKSAFDALFKKFTSFLGLETIFDEKSIKNLSFFDKLKFMLAAVLDGSFKSAIGDTEVVKFIKWFGETIFNVIKEKFQSVKKKILSWFGISDVNDEMEGMLETFSSSSSMVMASTSSSNGIVSGINNIKESIMSVSDVRTIDWNKLLMPGTITFIIIKILNTLRLLSDSFALSGIGDNISNFVGNISKAFASFAAVSTLTTIIEFASVVAILTYSMSLLAKMDTGTIATNIDQLFRIMTKMVEVIGIIIGIQAGASVFSKGGGMLMNMIAGGGTGMGSKNYLWSLTAFVLGFTAGIAILLTAVRGLAKVPIDKVEPIFEKVFGKADENGSLKGGLLEKVFGMIGGILFIAGIFGVLGEKAGAKSITNQVGGGKFVFALGNVSKTIKSPFAGVGDILKQIANILLVMIGGFIALSFAIVLLLKMDRGEEAYEKAKEILQSVLMGVITLITMLFLMLGIFGKMAGGADKAVPMLKQLGWTLLALGYSLSTISLSIMALILAVSKESMNASKLHNVEAILGIMFGGIILILVIIMGFVKLMRSKGGEFKVYEESAKLMNSIKDLLLGFTKSIKWVILAIAALIKVISKNDISIAKLHNVEIILAVVFGGIALILGLIMLFAKTLRSQGKDKAGKKHFSEYKIFDETAMLFESIGKILGILAGSITAIVLVMAALMFAIDSLDNDKSFKHAGWVMTAIFAGIILLLGAILAFAVWVKKQNINMNDLANVFTSIAWLMASIALVIGVMAGAYMLMALVIDNLNGEDTFARVNAVMGIMFAAIAFLLAGFAVAVYAFNKTGVKAEEAMKIALAFDIFAASFIILAFAIAKMADVMQSLDPDTAKNVFIVLGAFVGILSVLGVLSAVTGNALGLGMLMIAGSFLMFGLALLSVAAAIYVLAKAFDLFIDVIIKFGEAKDRIEKGIAAIEELLPRMKNVVKELVSGAISGAIDAFKEKATEIGEALGQMLTDGLTWLSKNLQPILNALSVIFDTIKTFIKDKILEWFKNNGAEKQEGVSLIGEFFNGLLQALLDQLKKLVDQGGVLGTLAKPVYNAFKKIGDHASDGLYKGIDEGKKDAEKAGEDLGNAAAEGTKKSLKTKSPSRVMEWIGKMAVQGLNKGYGNKSEQSGLLSTIGTLKDKMTGALEGTGEDNNLLGGLTDRIQGLLDESDLTANITGVLNMDDMTDQLGSVGLNGIMDGTSMDTSSLMGDTASAFSDMKMSTDASALMNQNGTGDVYNVTTMEQNNYSPKSMDAATQYRQSKNLVDASFAQDKQSWGFKPRRVDSGRVTAGGRPIYVYKK